jgi:flagella basal body P-ring formation protein FlgA
MSTIRSLVLAAFALTLFSTANAAAQSTQLTLRSDIAASGALVTLGDVFENAGTAASRPIGPAPRAGASGTLSPRVLENAARAAGLSWNAPEGLRVVEVRGGGVHQDGGRDGAGAIAIRRGDVVTLTFTGPGLRLTARTRALHEAALGGPVRLTNLQSNQVIDAIATAPGRASANLDAAPQ